MAEFNATPGVATLLSRTVPYYPLLTHLRVCDFFFCKEPLQHVLKDIRGIQLHHKQTLNPSARLTSLKRWLLIIQELPPVIQRCGSMRKTILQTPTMVLWTYYKLVWSRCVGVHVHSKNGKLTRMAVTSEARVPGKLCLDSGKEIISFVTLFVLPVGNGTKSSSVQRYHGIDKAMSYRRQMQHGKLLAVLNIFLESIQVYQFIMFGTVIWSCKPVSLLQYDIHVCQGNVLGASRLSHLAVFTYKIICIIFGAARFRMSFDWCCIKRCQGRAKREIVRVCNWF